VLTQLLDPGCHRTGEAVQSGLHLHEIRECLGIHGRDPTGIEGLGQAFGEPGRTDECPLHRDLLIEEHPDEQGQGLSVEQLIGFGIAGDVEGAPHHATASG